MKWTNESAQNPGYSVWSAVSPRDPKVQYAIRQKRKARGWVPINWKVFMRNGPGEPLRTIFVAEKLAEAKQFVIEWEKVHEQK